VWLLPLSFFFFRFLGSLGFYPAFFFWGFCFFFGFWLCAGGEAFSGFRFVGVWFCFVFCAAVGMGGWFFEDILSVLLLCV